MSYAFDRIAGPCATELTVTAVTVTGLTTSFATTKVLHGVDLHVPAGSLTAALGPTPTSARR